MRHMLTIVRPLMIGTLWAAISVMGTGAESGDEEGQVAFESLAKNEAGEPIVGRTWSVAEMVGNKVRDRSGNDLGLVEDVAIDLRGGQIELLLVKEEGATDAEAGCLAIPWRAVKVPADLSGPAVFDLPVVEALHRDAPRITAKASLTHQDTIKACRQFGIELTEARPSGSQPGRERRRPQHVTELPPNRELTRWTNLAGTPIENDDHARLGCLEDLAVIPARGAIAYAVVAADDLSQDTFHAVPVSAFIVRPKSRPWLLELPRDSFQRMPTFSASERPDLIARGWLEYVFVRYGRSPFDGVGTQTQAEQEQNRADKQP